MDLEQIGEYLADFALLWPGILLTVVLSLLAAPRLARSWRVATPIVWLLLFAVGLIASATLTPSREALQTGVLGSGICDLGRIGPASIREILAVGDTTFNIALFVPLGVAVGLVPRLRPRIVLLAFGLVLSPLIETTQLLVRPLDRACQSSDVFDNLTGFVAGLIAAWLIARLLATRKAPPERDNR